MSTWHRVAPNTIPAMAKIAGNYLGGQLIKMEALTNGYDEAIALGPDGMLSEGSGQNVFAVDGGVLYTPPIDGTLLPGITCDTVIALASLPWSMRASTPRLPGSRPRRSSSMRPSIWPS